LMMAMALPIHAPAGDALHVGSLHENAASCISAVIAFSNTFAMSATPRMQGPRIARRDRDAVVEPS
jgi:hypothetical protein